MNIYIYIYLYIYIYKSLKNLSERGFWCIISAWYFHENSPYVTLYQLTKFQCHIFFPSGDIKQKVLLSSYLDKVDVIKFTIYLESSSKPMADREKLRRSRKSKNENVKGFLHEIKSIFHNYLKAHSHVWSNFWQLKSL